MIYTQIHDGFKLVDVHHNSIYRSMIDEYVKSLQSDHNHRLIENYSSFEFDLYIKVFAVFDRDNLVSFSCIQEFPNNQWRIATRLWTDPNYRSQHMLPSSWNGKYLMPAQVKWIEDQGWEYPFVFWSREPPVKNLQWTLKKVNRLQETIHEHSILDGYYNTGKNYRYTKNIKNCWQKIICVQSPNFSKMCTLPYMADNDYDRQYSK